MSVFKKYNGKRITSKYKDAKFYMWKRIGKGKILHKVLSDAQTKEQAEIAERKEIEKVFNKRYGIADNETTFTKFVDTTYKKYVKQHNVDIVGKGIFIAELKKFFKNKLLVEITAQDCRDYQFMRKHKKTRFGAKRSPSSVNKETSTLSKIFTLACQKGILERNPMQYVVKLEEPKARRRLLTDAQKESLWKELEKDEFLYQIVTLAINLPLRKGQLLAITKEAVDFSTSTLMAVSSKKRPPRPVPMNSKVAAVLKELCDKVPSGHLFLYKGKPIRDFKKRWHTALLNAGINKEDGSREENYHFHDVRSWFSQRLLKRNQNKKVIQDLFAHSDASITDIYLTSDEEMMFEAVRSLDDDVIQNEGVN
jgi:integrase